jgi:hypothetical protein
MRSAIGLLCFGGRRVPTGILLRRVPPHARYAALAVDEWLKGLSYNNLSKLDEDHEFVYTWSDSEDEESTHYPIQTDRK